LVAFGLSARERLKIKDFDDTGTAEDVMVATDALVKSKRPEKRSQGREVDIVVRATSNDLIE
jgi:hypothetical protein